MTRFLLAIVTFFLFFRLHAQEPSIQWARSYGGSYDDQALKVKLLRDGGFVVAGVSNSYDGDVANTRSAAPKYWILNLDDKGAIRWQRCFENKLLQLYEPGIDFQQTSDNGYIFAGCFEDYSDTPWHGSYDLWVAKTDDTGGVIWHRGYGGTGMDYASSVVQTADGGYLVGGTTNSADYAVKGNHGNYDGWLLKLDSSGNLKWQKCLGGSNDDGISTIVPAVGGGYFVAGGTNSTDGDVTGGHGSFDYWLLKIDDTGGIIWQNTYGGSAEDDLSGAAATADGGCIMGGTTYSTDGQVAHSLAGCSSGWVAKVNAAGTLQWAASLGIGTPNAPVSTTSQANTINSVHTTPDGGYIAVGSHMDPLSAAFPLDSYWITKLDSAGGQQWYEFLGGIGDDLCQDACQTADGGFILAGSTTSLKGDITTTHGERDYGLVKLSPINVSTRSNTVSVGPNPTRGMLYITCALKTYCTLQDMTGRAVPGRYDYTSINLSPLAGGVYLLNVYDMNGVKLKTEKVVKE